MTFVKRLFGIAVVGGLAWGQAITFPTPLTVNAVSTTGTSFTYSGTLTQAATITINQSGQACEQAGPSYCTNGAGVITYPGSSPKGAATTFSGTFGGTAGTWDYGALVMIISGVGAVQVFPANGANGLGASSPPPNLSVTNASLSSLGFPPFSIISPTITFVVADNNYPDNSGGFTLTQGAVSTTPIPPSLLLSLGGLTLVALWMGSRLARKTV